MALKGGMGGTPPFTSLRGRLRTAWRIWSAETSGGRRARRRRSRRTEAGGAEQLRHAECKICKHASTPAGRADRAFLNAHRKMIIYDYEKCGFVTDERLFKEMRDVFNQEQLYVGQDSVRVFTITTAEVAMHALHHDKTNPLRQILADLRFWDEAFRKASDSAFGLVDGKEFVNSHRISDLLKISKRRGELTREFMMMRGQLLLEIADQRREGMAGGGGEAQRPKRSRHLNGTGATGRFALAQLL